MTDDQEKERVEAMNRLANSYGQTLLEICGGDWALALSVAATLFASTLAQTAVEHDDNVEELFDEVGIGVREATMTFHAKFLEAEKNEQKPQ